MARVMDHIADQYDGPVGSDPPTWDFPRMGADSDSHQPEAANFRRLSVGSAPHDDEDGISDEEKSESDQEEAYTAVRSVVSIPKQAAEEAQENPKVAELKERLINAYPRLFSGVANKNPPDRGRFGTAKIKLKPNPKIYRHREYQLQGDRAEAMKKLLAEFIERGWIEPSDSEWASPAFIVPKIEKGEWMLVVDYRGLNEQTEHDSYSLPLVCKPTKASLFVKEVEFAGHVVGHGQRHPMPGKLASLHHWEKPQTISELRSFMGFCNYYSGYVPMYAELSGPLHRMLQVGKFDGRKGSKKKLAWTPEAEDAFSRLKERLLGQLGLFLVDPDKGFVLRTDASDYAVGAVLEQIRDDGSHMYPWRSGAGSWPRANAAPGPRGRRRRTPLYVRSGSGLATSDCNRWWFARTISPCRAGTRSTSTAPRDRRQAGPDGMTRSPSSTSASYTSRGRTTL